MPPRKLTVSVGTSLLTASLAVGAIACKRTVNQAPPDEPHVNEGPEPEDNVDVGPEDDGGDEVEEPTVNEAPEPDIDEPVHVNEAPEPEPG